MKINELVMLFSVDGKVALPGTVLRRIDEHNYEVGYDWMGEWRSETVSTKHVVQFPQSGWVARGPHQGDVLWMQPGPSAGEDFRSLWVEKAEVVYKLILREGPFVGASRPYTMTPDHYAVALENAHQRRQPARPGVPKDLPKPGEDGPYKDWESQTEVAYDVGRRQAGMEILSAVLNCVGRPERTKDDWRLERARIVNRLRDICHDHGDNDWDEEDSLEDVLERHLWDHLEAK